MTRILLLLAVPVVLGVLGVLALVVVWFADRRWEDREARELHDLVERPDAADIIGRKTHG